MTRFARASGSKSSNARVVEEATSWAEMKKQLLESKESTSQSSQEIQEKIVKVKAHKAEKKAQISEWAEFDTNTLLKPSYLQEHSDSAKSAAGKNKNQSKKPDDSKTDSNKKFNVKRKLKSDSTLQVNQNFKKTTAENKNDSHAEGKVAVPKKKGKIIKGEHQLQVSNTTRTTKTGAASNISFGGPNSSKPQNAAVTKKRRAEKQMEGTDPKRRKPLSDTIIVDGRSIEIEIYDGFPVLKEDAARLRELYKKMLNEGIPKAEARKAIKLERRRAEKALSREKKKVCFHCRQPGHMMTDCPKLSSGSCEVCFKCGSTEHKSPQCKVTQGNDFKFSTCFVCGESGHISRQCPDNPRGLYPQGGGCRICGDVTHLKRDCPQLREEREDKTVRVGFVASYNSIEDLDEKKPAPAISTEGPRKNKIIKF